MQGRGFEGWFSAVILALIGGLVGTVATTPAGSKRPPTQEGAVLPADAQPAAASLRAQTRLWEDPLGAAWLEWRAAVKNPDANSRQTSGISDAAYAALMRRIANSSDFKWFTDESQTVTQEDAPDVSQQTSGPPVPVTVLAVPLDDSRTPDAEENRMTQRQAVIGALHRLGLAPESSRSVFYFENPLYNDADRPTDLNGIIAYEWWRPEGDPDQGSILSRPCLVLYYGRGALGGVNKQELAAFERLIARIGGPAPTSLNADQNIARPVTMPSWGSNLREAHAHLVPQAILMRTSSTSLLHDVVELANREETDWPDFVCLNATSTADAETLFKGVATGAKTVRDNIERWIEQEKAGQRDGRLPVHRVLGTDRRLLSLLVTEMRLRGVSLNDPRNVVAIIHERDTEFGRALRTSFEAAAGDTAGNLVPISYLAAVDGDTLTVPRADRSRSGANGNGTAASLDAAIASSGQPQLDYIYRALRQKAEELRISRSGKLRAVFIGASDRWDVRPVIQMVRRHFPHVMIIATDLYAQYTDPSDYGIMRNMIVASHLGLALHPELQGGIPPFRSSYQAATFLTVLQGFAALDTGDAVVNRFTRDDDTSESARTWKQDVHALLAGAQPDGRIFEISRNGAIKLPDATSQDEQPEDRAFYATNLRPGLVAFTLDRAGRLLVLLAGLGGIALIVTSRLIGLYPEASQRRRRAMFLGPYIAAITTLFSIAFLAVATGTWHDATRLIIFLCIAFAACVIIVFLTWTWRYKEGSALPRHAEGEGESLAWRSIHREGFLIVGVVWTAIAIALFIVAWGSVGQGEPFSWSNGVSVWPTELLRVVAILIGIGFLWYHISAYLRSRRGDDGDEGNEGGVRTIPRGPAPGAPGNGCPPEESNGGVITATLDSGAGGFFRRMALRARNGFAVLTWDPPLADHQRRVVDAEKLCRELHGRLHPAAAALRIAAVATPFILLAMMVFWVDPPYLYAVRGDIARAVDATAAITLAIVLNAAVFVVWDSARVYNRYIRNLSYGSWAKWSDTRLRRYARETGVDRRLVGSLIDVQEIGRDTAAINGRIYWPVALILLSTLALHSRFDAWPLSWTTVMFFGLSLLIAVYAGFMVRRAAEYARTVAITRLERWALNPRMCIEEHQDHIEPSADSSDCLPGDDGNGVAGERWAKRETEDAAKGSGRPGGKRRAGPRRASNGAEVEASGDGGLAAAERPEKTASRPPEIDHHTAERLAKQAATLITRIRSLREGAFAPWTEDPIFRATMLPLAGFLSVQAVEWARTMM